MDVRTGEIAALDEFTKHLTPPEMNQFIRPLDIDLLRKTNPSIARILEETGRAQLVPRSKCPCGSGKRFKSCCMQKFKPSRSLPE